MVVESLRSNLVRIPRCFRVAADRPANFAFILSREIGGAEAKVLFDRFGLQDLPQNQKRASLAATVLLHDIVKARDL